MALADCSLRVFTCRFEPLCRLALAAVPSALFFAALPHTARVEHIRAANSSARRTNEHGVVPNWWPALDFGERAILAIYCAHSNISS